MFDVSNKARTARVAKARASLTLQPETIRRVRERQVPKGDPLEVAKVAAIQAAKNTSQIIPYCHPIPVDHVAVEYDLADDRIEVMVTVKAIYKTGVEMEALTAASVCALTLYDMLKMLDESMAIREVRLIHGRGKGVQRAAVQRLLAGHPLVARFRDAPDSHLGATLVMLRPADEATGPS